MELLKMEFARAMVPGQQKNTDMSAPSKDASTKSKREGFA
jgi:hypothetical protein